MAEDIGRAIALMLVFEGILPFVAPRRWQDVMKALSIAEERSLRSIGLFSMGVGIVLLWLFR
tara:strand:- start:87 stop:272 length:186 start_codon:yes stop_codon:yes gene_type:complete